MDRSTAFSLVDADVHNYPNALADLMPFLSARWQAYAKRLGLPAAGRIDLSQGLCRCRAAAVKTLG